MAGYAGGLFIPFRDATNGTETYGAGRYLVDAAKSADLGGDPASGTLIVDFNFAFQPSCAFDPRWACPLAPPENRLDLPIRAGERRTADNTAADRTGAQRTNGPWDRDGRATGASKVRARWPGAVPVHASPHRPNGSSGRATSGSFAASRPASSAARLLELDTGIVLIAPAESLTDGSPPRSPSRPTDPNTA